MQIDDFYKNLTISKKNFTIFIKTRRFLQKLDDFHKNLTISIKINEIELEKFANCYLLSDKLAISSADIFYVDLNLALFVQVLLKYKTFLWIKIK